MLHDEDEVNSLRTLIDSHLRRNNVYVDIRKFIKEYGASNANDERRLLSEIANRIADVPADAVKQDGLVVHVLGVRGDDDMCEKASLMVHFGESRFVLPDMRGTFLVKPKVSCKMHFVVVKDNELIASHEFEWRRILSGTGANVNVEIKGVRPLAGSFFLDLRLDCTGTGRTYTSDDIDMMIRQEILQKRHMERQFSHYSNRWWSEYIDLDSTFKDRTVKIFAENEWNQMVSTVSLVHPIRANRLIDSPQMAARWVSLLPYVKEELVGGGRLQVWHTPHTILSCKKGDIEDHALLLCSLFLGLGLDAYICIGEHVCVVTLNKEKPTFWESLTGMRMRERPKCHCLFNNTSFYANKQVTQVDSFDLRDDTKWKSMDERLLGFPAPDPFVMTPPRGNCVDLAESLEKDLRLAVTNERIQQYELETQWDEDLSYFMSPALSAYETEKCTGVLYGNEEFQQIIKRHIPRGHSFKGYPTMFNHNDPELIFHSLRAGKIPADILSTRADHTHFALRVHVYTYPEDLIAVWVMLSVRYRSS